MQKKSLRKSKPTLGMKIPPWNFSLWGAGLDPNSSRSWTDPPRPPQKGSMKPPRPPHGATKGIPARKKNTSWKQQKNQLEKTPNPLRSPLPRVKLKTKVGGREVPPAWTPPGAPGEGGKTLCSRWEPENGDTEGGWGGFGIRLDCVSRRCGWIFLFWGRNSKKNTRDCEV